MTHRSLHETSLRYTSLTRPGDDSAELATVQRSLTARIAPALALSPPGAARGTRAVARGDLNNPGYRTRTTVASFVNGRDARLLVGATGWPDLRVDSYLPDTLGRADARYRAAMPLSAIGPAGVAGVAVVVLCLAALTATALLGPAFDLSTLVGAKVGHTLAPTLLPVLLPTAGLALLVCLAVVLDTLAAGRRRLTTELRAGDR
ncbi:hypothetical protein AB0D10_22205 [Kitasatospora sp. NPDC048545]|uniref:hypothetical protein n=1 Tax=Kitasatospora sp. NPDC048545 TaxID=3157208 RepID=UPI0033EA4A19